MLSVHSFSVGAATDLLEQNETHESLVLRGGQQTDLTATQYLEIGHTKLNVALQPINHDFNRISPIRSSHIKFTFNLSAI